MDISRDISLPLSLLTHAGRTPGQTFLEVWDEEQRIVQATVSFTDLAAMMLGAGVFLRGCGVVVGARVAMLAHNSVAYIAMSLGAMALGSVSVNLNWRMPKVTTCRLLSRFTPWVLCASNPWVEEARTLCASIAMHLVHLVDPSSPPCDSLLPNHPAAADLIAKIHAMDKGTPAAIFFTGGTTGDPRAVSHTQSSLFWLAESFLRSYPEPFSPGTHPGTLCFTPYFHVMGFVANLVFNLHCGCRAFLLAGDREPSARIILNACAALRPSILNTVPWIVEGLVALIQQGEVASNGEAVAAVLSRLRLLTYGGGSLAPHCPPVLAAHGVLLNCTYGQTELGGPLMFGKPGGDPNLLRPFKGVSCRLVKEAGGEDEGELVMLGNMSTTASYVHPEPLARPLSPGSGTVTMPAEYRTGDRFRIERLEEDGGCWLRYLCRKDDLLVHTSGEMTNPLPTEQQVLAMCSSLLCTVVLCGNGLTRPILILEITAGNANKASRALIRQATRLANAHQPSFATVLPQHVLMIPPGSLPRTVKGGVQRRLVEGRLRGGGLRLLGTHSTEGGDGCSLCSAGSARGSLLLVADERKLEREGERASVVTSHTYLACMALVLLHHLPKVRDGCASGCGIGPGTIELFGEAVAMPAFATFAGALDLSLPSARAMRIVAVHASLSLGGALLLAHVSGVSTRVWWMYRFLVFAPNRGVLKAPAKEYFTMHYWFMVALPTWRLVHALLRSLGWQRALPLLSLLLHFCCVGANCHWPFLRHPHELATSAGALSGYYGGGVMRALAAALPQNDLSVIPPYFLFYAAVPAVMPRGFPCTLPEPTLPQRLQTLLQRRRIDGQTISRGLWVCVLLTLLASCACTVANTDTAMDPADGANLRAILEASLYHTKRAYGCSKNVFPPRLLDLATDGLRPCGGPDRRGKWSRRGLLLDALGVAISSAAVVGIVAAVPRTRFSWTTVGAHTLSVYLLHLYVLPAVEVTLSAAAQALAFGVHPEVAMPTALTGCLFVIRGIALPVGCSGSYFAVLQLATCGQRLAACKGA